METGMVVGHKINILHWQSQFPDLKPIEKLWIGVGSLLHKQTWEYKGAWNVLHGGMDKDPFTKCFQLLYVRHYSQRLSAVIHQTLMVRVPIILKPVFCKEKNKILWLLKHLHNKWLIFLKVKSKSCFTVNQNEFIIPRACQLCVLVYTVTWFIHRLNGRLQESFFSKWR